MKKLLSLLLAVTLLAGVVCFAPAYAEEPETPYPAPVPENLAWDGTCATWSRYLPPDEITDYEEYSYSYYYAFYYTVELFKVPEGEGEPTSLGAYTTYTGVKYDFGEKLAGGGYGDYYFTVKCSRNGNVSEPAKSEVKTFTPETTKLKLPMPKLDGWKVTYAGNCVAYWSVPTDNLPSDAEYGIHVNLYKNKELFKEYDFSAWSTSYDFTNDGAIPTDSEDVFYIGVKLVPAETETRYAESDERVGSSNTVCPATLLARRIFNLNLLPCRAGDTKWSFTANWSGAYGLVKKIFVKLYITSTDGTETETADGICWNLNYVQGSSTFNYDNYLDYTFKEGDVVNWELTLGSSYDDPACEPLTGTFTVEAPVPHTVTLDAQGLGENTTVTVPDRQSLSSVENVTSLYPKMPGYVLIGFSKEKKAMEEYTYNDLFSGNIYEDLTLYAVVKPAVDTVEINLEAPVCGQNVTLKRVDEEGGYFYYEMSVQPKVTFPEDAPYALYSTNGWWYHIVTPEPDESGETPAPQKQSHLGKFVGDEQYVVSFELDMKENDDGVPEYGFVPYDQIKINGNFTAAEATSGYTSMSYSYMYFSVTVTAVHDWGEWKQTVAPEQGKNGVEERVCAGCGKTETREITHVHKLTKQDAVPATCTAPGNVEYYVCGVCGKAFADDKGVNEISLESTVIPVDPDAHAWGDWTKLDENQHQRVCAHDSSHKETEAHAWDAGKVTTEPTATADGVKTFTCTVCGAEKTEPIPKPAFLLGDVDNDGKVTAGDARAALRIAVSLDPCEPGSRAFFAADVDLSESVTAADARLILRRAVDLVDPEWGVKKQ